MKTKKIALLLPLLPMLMANSAVRTVYSNRYEDFTASYAGEEIIDNYRYQVFHVKNIGEGYISSFNVTGSKYDYDFSATAGEDGFYPIFDSVLIAPNQEIDIKVKSYTPIVAIDSAKLSYYAYAYTAFVEGATVSGTKVVELLKQEETYCYYSIDLKVDNAPSNEANAVVLKAKYDGNDVYLKLDSYRKYRFYTNEALDLSKLEIGDPVAILKNAPEDYEDGFGDVIEFFGRLLIIFITILFIVGSIIFLAIFLPKIIRKSNERKRRQALEEKQNNQEDKRE